ncbi:MAG: hypothetical protein ACREB3_13290, partial [Burkholderiales bacterium]
MLLRFTQTVSIAEAGIRLPGLDGQQQVGNGVELPDVRVREITLRVGIESRSLQHAEAARFQ